VKKLEKVFAREEKRRKELPLELKQKVSYEILERMRDLGENSNTTEQRGTVVLHLYLLLTCHIGTDQVGVIVEVHRTWRHFMIWRHVFCCSEEKKSCMIALFWSRMYFV
jgi:hypothetical protein